jgi:signal transduction histidine kinase
MPGGTGSVLASSGEGRDPYDRAGNGTDFCGKGAEGDGQGFVSMAARARKLGGTLSVLSRPAKGTRVVLDFPKKTSVEDVKLLPRLEPVVRRAM